MESQGVRLPWAQVPESVRSAVADLTGSAVVVAENQPGGFSPGVAARCQLADGRRCFIKAVSPDQNPDSPHLHRREVEVAGALPADLPVPKLLGSFDDGHWVVLVFEEIEGRPPHLPWSLNDLRATFDALKQLAEAATPCPVPGLPSVADVASELFSGYRRLAGGDRGNARVDPWTRRHLDHLATLEADWEPAAAGESLLHNDIRADNLLVRPDRTVVIVDWPHAAFGAPWVDLVLLLPSVGLDGGPAPTDVEAALDPFSGVDGDAVNRVLVGLSGAFTYLGLQPDPPGLPTLRAFQRAQAAVARTWLARRLGLS